MNEEELAAFEEQQQKAQAIEELQTQELKANVEKMALENEKLGAQIEELKLKAETESVKDDKLIAETEQVLSNIEKNRAEIREMSHTVKANIQSQIDSIKI